MEAKFLKTHLVIVEGETEEVFFYRKFRKAPPLMAGI